MDSLPTVVVRPGEAERILSGHPWIYEGAILRIPRVPPDGALVQIKDHRHRFLGVGLFNGKSKIRVRVFGLDRVDLTEDLFSQRLQAARVLRQQALPGASCFRAVNSESDFLSGLIVDKYEDVIVLQVSSLGLDQRKSAIVAALQKTYAPRAIFERNDTAARQFEGLPQSSGLLTGDLGSDQWLLEVSMNELRFDVNLATGHKTGLYLDQQLNYRAVAALAQGCHVLDCFSFVGGFALHAARAGAASVLGLEQSAEAVEQARRNAARNHLADRCTFEQTNVFDWFKQATGARPHEKVIPRFDLIILDPPSFTRSRASVGDALRGYKEIHLRALKLLKRPGRLATFCCSHHVDGRMFEEVILDAALDTRRILRRTASYFQSPDHPIVPAIPETEYLKGFAYDVL